MDAHLTYLDVKVKREENGAMILDIVSLLRKDYVWCRPSIVIVLKVSKSGHMYGFLYSVLSNLVRFSEQFCEISIVCNFVHKHGRIGSSDAHDPLHNSPSTNFLQYNPLHSFAPINGSLYALT